MTLVSPNRGYPLQRIDGSSGSMSYWHGLFTSVADKLSTLRTSSQTAGDLPGNGAAVTAARTDADELVSALSPNIAEAELLAGVIQRYADAYDNHAQRANGMIEDIETAHASWASFSGMAQNAGNAALALSYGDDQAAIDLATDVAVGLIGSRDQAKQELDELWIEYEGYYGDWDEAYDAALAELAGGTGTVLTSDARDLLNDLLGADSPEEVQQLWNQHPELHDEILAAHPEIIGNLDGIPYDVRSDANHRVLEDLYNSDLDEPLRSDIDALWNEVELNGGHLISFDPNGSEQVTAALWFGDFDAGNVSVMIPGMNSTVSGIGEWGASARDLNADVGPGSATVVWFGYDSPTIPEEPFMDRAEDGAAALASFLRGLDVTIPSSQVNVVAHSYGSTTAALAIGSQPDGLGVDQFIILGSAGFPSDPEVLANLETGPQIFGTLSEGDVWARIGRDTSWGGGHSTVPETLPGVVEFGSDGGYASDGSQLGYTPGHGTHDGGNSIWGWWEEDNGYLSPGTESFYNIGEIILNGEPGTEMDGEGSENGFWGWVPDWLPVSPYRF